MIFILFIVIEVVISYKCLTVKNYNIESDKIKENVKVVLVSDLHYGTFGENNKRLVSKIKECKPDLILFDGDMINEESKNLQTVIKMCIRDSFYSDRTFCNRIILLSKCNIYYSWR